jgi:hypothetical protein
LTAGGLSTDGSRHTGRRVARTAPASVRLPAVTAVTAGITRAGFRSRAP